MGASSLSWAKFFPFICQILEKNNFISAEIQRIDMAICFKKFLHEFWTQKTAKKTRRGRPPRPIAEHCGREGPQRPPGKRL